MASELFPSVVRVRCCVAPVQLQLRGGTLAWLVLCECLYWVVATALLPNVPSAVTHTCTQLATPAEAAAGLSNQLSDLLILMQNSAK